MDLPNLKELQAILKLCRKQGVTDITLGEITIKFGDLPKEGGEVEEESTGIANISPEDLAYWSSQPDPLAMREGAEQ